MEFNGKYALITGAASGMGRIYALRLSEMGYGLIAVDINKEALDRLCEGITSVPVIPACINLATSGAASKLATLADENNAQVEVLVNNAGMIVTRPIADTDPSRLEAMMMLHCTTPLLLCREFVPRMKEAGSGYILNISSICAWMDWPIIGMYGNTKRFVKGYSRSLRVENADSGISVTTAYFGAVDTPLFGFPDRMRRIMLGTGVMISPEKAVDRALKATFKKRKAVMPGLFNRTTVILASLLPDFILKRLVKRFGHLFR